MSSEKHMTRLRDAGGTEIEQRLLASAAADEMPEEKFRALVQWGTAIAPTEAAPPAAMPGWKLPLAKGLGVLALAAASVGAFDYVSSRSSGPVGEPHDVSKAVPVSVGDGADRLEAPPAPSPAGTVAAVPVVTADDLPSVPVAVPSAAPPARSVAKKPVLDEVSLGEQMAFIDSARTRLRQGDPRAALTVLDEYKRRYPEPAFREEATVLRVSALAKAGDVAEARRLGEAFLSTHPAELYSRRVEGIVRSLESQESSQ
ncbi:MAG: hypothetical protein BGO98_40620 [Myxococcales bacterium 68-20]|nr:outer membrane protein assembly factor BamD [Myxococcales bacterium]OJY19779.1 MAG: hypothetical protein BGO98_40620 [Myxococcales bacterium 68-20]